jgi:hypothetical protein
METLGRSKPNLLATVLLLFFFNLTLELAIFSIEQSVFVIFLNQFTNSVRILSYPSGIVCSID